MVSGVLVAEDGNPEDSSKGSGDTERRWGWKRKSRPLPGFWASVCYCSEIRGVGRGAGELVAQVYSVPRLDLQARKYSWV